MDRFFKPWLPARPPTYLFVNANVVDTVSGTITPDARVYVADGHIISVSTEGDEQLPEGAERIDLEGQFLCPGLTDAHVHITATPGETDLKNMINVDENTILLRTTYVCRDIISRGFTMARDCGGAPFALNEAIEDGLIPGPRLSIAGHVLSQTGGHGDLRSSYQHSSPECSCGQVKGLARICDGVPECLHMARDELRRGSDFLKIMGSGGVISPTDAIEDVQFTPDEIRAITSVANAAGKYATSHAYTPKAILNAINNGVMGIEHGNLLDAPTAKIMAEKGVFLTPTLVTYATMAEGPFANFLPAVLKAKNRNILESGYAALKFAKEAGVVICFGTDLLGPLGAFQSAEFSLRSKLLSPLEILQSATINPAKMMGLPKSGQIREGFWADLIVLKSNPLVDITVLDRTKTELIAVFKEGRPYYSKLAGVKGSLD
jgi:imidazolonepropionase-like amidohydrolase